MRLGGCRVWGLGFGSVGAIGGWAGRISAVYSGRRSRRNRV